MLKMAQQPLRVGDPDAARLPRTYVLFTDKSPETPLAPAFASIAARLREDKRWNYLEKPFVHYPVLDQPDGVEKVTDLLLELTA